LFDLHFVAQPSDRTLFTGIHQLPPGCYLLTDGEQVRVIPYWDWDFPQATSIAVDRTPREWIERLGNTLQEAVRLRLRADVPVGCYLSGGIDSCAVLGFATQLSTAPIRAFTLSFDHAEYDEADIAERQARKSGAELCRIDIRADDLADHFAAAVYHSECPVLNAHSVAKYLLSRAVRDAGIKVVLTGEGSDEVFGGYPHFRRDHILHGDSERSPSEKAHLLRNLEAANVSSAGTLLPRGTTHLESVQRILGFVPSALQGWAQISSGLLHVAHADFIAEFAERDSFRVLLNCLDVERQLKGRAVLNQSLYVWGKTMLPNYVLTNLGDRMEMAHSVEGRLPFLDHHVVEEAARMPVEMKINGMTEKYVLREAARHVLIEAVYARQKHPFMSPPATLQPNGKLWAFIQDTLRSKLLEGPGIYDRAKVLALLEALPAMDRAERSRVDALLMWVTSLCLLCQQLRRLTK
jgi:asparagine synthase (glutamine-hydrolysing)